MTGSGYPATPLLRRLTAAHGWHHDLACDARGEPVAVVAVRVGSVWTDSVVIAGESETLAMRHRTNDDRLILPTEPASESRAVWRRHGRCEDVLVELFELPFDPHREAKPHRLRVSLGGDDE
ncbi:MAG: hypothetical protein LC799_18530 [Actinobacteria bacterium]|nr:hypothetical protein [Actinomycetota bacterium]